MSRRNPAAWLVAIPVLLSCLVPPAAAGEPSPRRRAEIERLIAKRRLSRSHRHRGAEYVVSALNAWPAPLTAPFGTGMPPGGYVAGPVLGVPQAALVAPQWFGWAPAPVWDAPAWTPRPWPAPPVVGPFNEVVVFEDDRSTACPTPARCATPSPGFRPPVALPQQPRMTSTHSVSTLYVSGIPGAVAPRGSVAVASSTHPSAPPAWSGHPGRVH